MPELPEVEVVRSGLAPVLTGAGIARVHVRDPRSLKRHRGPLESFVDELEGARLDMPLRRGKFMWVPLAGQNRALVCHLGMSGQVLLGDDTSDFGSHLRILLELEEPRAGASQVGFVDQRIFGSMAIDDLVDTGDAQPAGYGSDDARVPSSVAHIARDPLDPGFDLQAFSRRLRAKNTEIKRALLDQTLISGIGNIYADEALWATKLHYRASTASLRPARVSELVAAVRSVVRKALAEGGTSFDQQYVNVNGVSGYFSHSLNAYGRAGQACPRCRAIMVREAWMNRSSHRCPRCQRTPRSR